jgi:hypothetical protein
LPVPVDSVRILLAFNQASAQQTIQVREGFTGGHQNKHVGNFPLEQRGEAIHGAARLREQVV